MAPLKSLSEILAGPVVYIYHIIMPSIMRKAGKVSIYFIASYQSIPKKSLTPLKYYTEISSGPVESTLKITSGPVQLKDQNNR